MKTIRSALLLLVAVFGCSADGYTASPPAAESPEQFVKGVFRTLSADNIRKWAAFDGGEGAELIYSRAMISAMRGNTPRMEDRLMWAKVCGCRYTVKGEDPTCGCPGNAKPSGLSTTQQSTEVADVRGFLNLENRHQSRLTWHLIATPQGWRIDDVSTQDFPSIKSYLLRN